MEIEKVHRPLKRDFNEHFVRNRIPVVITGLLDEWPAMQKWSLNWLRQEHGTREFVRRGDGRKVTLAAHLDEVEQSDFDRPAGYLRNVNIQTHWPELMADVTPRIDITAPDWLSSRLLPSGWPRVARYLNQFFLSGRGATIPIHFDEWMMHAFISNVMGEKEFLLFPPSESCNLYPRKDYYLVSDIDKPFGHDAEKFPLYSNAKTFRVVVGPGESVFVPCGWWHTTRTLSPCISISSNFVNEHNWTLFRHEMRDMRTKLRGQSIKGRVMDNYLLFVGLMLRTRLALGFR